MTDTLRVGFIGAGSNTRVRHLPGLLALDGVSAVAVCNRSAESGRRVADEFGVARVETDPAQVLEADDVDAVCIGTWPDTHSEYSVRALEAGKHVLCEARMAADARQAREMLAASRARPDLVAQVVPAPMDLAIGPTVRRILGDGSLGQILEAHVDVLGGAGLHVGDRAHWRQQRRYSGLNVMSFGIFAEIVTRWLGPTEHVMADAEMFVTHGEGESASDVPDSLGVLARLTSGARVTYRMSMVTSAGEPMRVALYGTEGSLVWRGGTDLTITPLDSEPVTMGPDEGTDVGWRVEADFVESIREGRPVELTSFDDGVRYMELTEAVHRSRTEGRRMHVADISSGQ